jgi:hypothetical protein
MTMIEKDWLPNAYVPHVDKYQKFVEEKQNELSNRLTSILSGSMKRTVEKQQTFLKGAVMQKPVFPFTHICAYFTHK